MFIFILYSNYFRSCKAFFSGNAATYVENLGKIITPTDHQAENSEQAFPDRIGAKAVSNGCIASPFMILWVTWRNQALNLIT